MIHSDIRKTRRWFQPLLLGGLLVLIVASYSDRWSSASGVLTSSGQREYIGDFAFAQVGGGRWRLSDHRGKVVLLNFWATWCPPCRQETPGLVELSDRMRSKGVVIVGVSMDDDDNAILAFAKAFHISYPIVLPPPDSALAGSVESLPTTLLIDRNGRVAHSYIGAVSETTFATDIERLLHETAPKSDWRG